MRTVSFIWGIVVNLKWGFSYLVYLMLSSVAFLFLSSYNQRLTYYIMFLECVCIGLGYTWCMRYVELGCRKCFAVLFLLLNATFIMWVTEVRSPEISRYLCTQWLLYGHFRGLELRVALHIHNFRKYDTVGLPRVKTGEFLTYWMHFLSIYYDPHSIFDMLYLHSLLLTCTLVINCVCFGNW